MKKFPIGIISDNVNIHSAILNQNIWSNILKVLKFLVGDKKYWIWGKARELNICNLENNAGSWRNRMIVYKYVSVIIMKV